MRFGFMEDFRNPVKWRRPFAEFYQQILEQIKTCEQIGYDNVWLTEHHFTDDGYNPSLMTTAAGVATATKQIRIGTFIVILPYQHPVLLAEEVANVDILSNGRFEFGVGQGYSYHEYKAFCMERSERGPKTRESIQLIERLFNEEKVTHNGKFFKTHEAKLSPKPVQDPHPPIWIGGRGPKAVKKAAQMGFHLMATIGPDPAPDYISALKESGRNPIDYKIAQLRMVYCADSEDQAWEECQEHLFHLIEFYHDILSEANDADGDDAPLPISRPEDMRNSVLADHFMIGTPEQVSEKLSQFQIDFTCTDLIMGTQFPGLNPKLGTNALKLFGEKVMPKFKK
ncbi:LLM class flavin-dependent oxidoreductase [Pseudomonadota bacterium]|nr:LLM class flavin-dependent oxidoreductase [Pseudomonadota bacterium]